MTSNSELERHFKRNEAMWKIWENNGINPETEFIVNFHFYCTKKEYMEKLCQELKLDELIFRIKENRTLLFFKGWEVEADIKQKWTLPLLQAKMGRLFVMSQQTNTSLEGCGALMP